MKLLGIDTSNYTTSCAWYDTDTDRIIQKKQLLPVAEGQAGLRQSDAVFHHTRQLPQMIAQLAEALQGTPLKPDAIGVSVSPRPEEGSYMPCFLAGKGAAEILAVSHGIPLYETSHQTGHILAALYSADCLSWLAPDAPAFLAFHVSGGTTDGVLRPRTPALGVLRSPRSPGLLARGGKCRCNLINSLFADGFGSAVLGGDARGQEGDLDRFA